MRTAGSAGTMPASLPKAEAASRRTSADGEQVSATSSSNTCGLTLFPNSVALAASFLSFIMFICLHLSCNFTELGLVARPVNTSLRLFPTCDRRKSLRRIGGRPSYFSSFRSHSTNCALTSSHFLRGGFGPLTHSTSRPRHSE